MAEVKKASKASGSKTAAKPAPTVARKAPPEKKAAPAKPAVTSKAKAAAATKPARPKAKKPAVIPLEQRRNYVEVAAYYIAAARAFAPGDPLQDWIQAEAEIDRLLKEGRLGVLPP